MTDKELHEFEKSLRELELMADIGSSAKKKPGTRNNERRPNNDLRPAFLP